jgi:hypothetical protein
MSDIAKVNNSSNSSLDMFEMMDKAYKFAGIMAKSDIIPEHYRGKPENVFIAVQTAYRMNLDPMLVMQNTFTISGKLGMNSTFAISLANSSGLFIGGIRYKVKTLNENIEGEVNFYNNGTKDKKKVQFSNIQVTAYTNLKSNGEEISYTIGMKEAIAEGWTTKAGNKYQSLPTLMLSYRAATLLIRTHAPEVMNGMHVVEEIEDVQASVRDVTPKTQTLSAKLDGLINEQVNDSNDSIIDTPEQNAEKLQELGALVLTHNISDELIGKWCNKAGVSSIAELDNSKIELCINHIKSQYSYSDKIEAA